MKTLIACALLLALAGAPAVAWADSAGEPLAVAVAVAPVAVAPVAGAPSEARDYAAREAAAPKLGEFAGGGDGVSVYIGGSAVVLVLFVVIIVLVV